jgi:thioredoxin 2
MRSDPPIAIPGPYDGAATLAPHRMLRHGARRFYPRDMSIIGCSTCGARNRVGPIDHGVPRCPKCKSELPWLVDADDDTFAAETTASVPVVVDLWAAWCGPCRMISPVLEELAHKHAGHLKVVKVDVDANPGLATRFDARSIPLLVVIRDGHEVDRIVGALPRAALEQRLAPVLSA